MAEQTTVADASRLHDGRLLDAMPGGEPGSQPLASVAATPPTGAASEQPPAGKLKWDPKWNTYRDNFGKAFSPVLHEHEVENGKAIPRISKGGRLMMKRGNNQKAKAASVLGPDAPQGQSGSPGPAIEGQSGLPPGAEVKATAMATVAACTAATSMFLGEHWKPAQDELEQLTAAYEAVLIESGSTGLSPKQALALMVGAYAFKRMDHPETQKRLAKMREKLAYLWGRWRGGAAHPTSAARDSAPHSEPVSPSDPSSSASSSAS